MARSRLWQVLLSPTHRLRALLLLGRFVSLGAWAVSEMLSVGIFPYILKLLLSAASELRPTLLYIWAKVLLHDPSCQTDLQRDAAYAFFIEVLRLPAHATHPEASDPTAPPAEAAPSASAACRSHDDADQHRTAPNSPKDVTLVIQV